MCLFFFGYFLFGRTWFPFVWVKLMLSMCEYVCIGVCMCACECMMQKNIVFFWNVWQSMGHSANILAQWKVNRYENIYFIDFEERALAYSKWREENSSNKKKRFTTFTRNCLFMNSPSNVCGNNKFTTIITTKSRNGGGGDSSSNSNNNNVTRENQLFMLLKTFGPFL